ncbi:hypothetical protein GCM10009551_098480 [Nocardiopsis tropica]|uniref:hypothetical protein n=1 Tax=Tsukamurella strandjordii TaxID=147577 RepID=UPI0031DAE776
MSGEFWRAEAALSRVLPGRLVTALLAEPRGVAAILRWGLRRRPAGQLFSHHRDLVVLMCFLVAMTVLEGAVLDFVLRMVLGPSPWVWIVLGLHLWAVYLMVAAYAGMVTRPHSLDDGVLRLRSGLGTEVGVAVTAIEAASPGRYPDFDRSNWRVDGAGNATMAPNEANLRLMLVPGSEVALNGRIIPAPRSIHLTADEPRRLASAIAAARDDLGATSR